MTCPYPPFSLKVYAVFLLLSRAKAKSGKRMAALQHYSFGDHALLALPHAGRYQRKRFMREWSVVLRIW